MQEPATPTSSRSETGRSNGSALRGEDFTTFIKALTEKYGLFEGKSRIKPPPLDFKKTPTQAGGAQLQQDQPRDSLSTASKTSREESIGHAEEGPGLLLSRHKDGQEEPQGHDKPPELGVPQSPESPNPRLEILPHASAPNHHSPGHPQALQLEELDAPSPSFSQSPTIPTSESEARFTRHLPPPLLGNWHHHENSSVNTFQDTKGHPEDESDSSASPSSPSSAPTPDGKLPGGLSHPPDPASTQASSQPALFLGRSPRRPARRLPLLSDLLPETESVDGSSKIRLLELKEEMEFAEGRSTSQVKSVTAMVLREDTDAAAQVVESDGAGVEEARDEELRETDALVGEVQNGGVRGAREEGRESGDDHQNRWRDFGAGSWLALNRSLRDNGFSALHSPQDAGFLEDVQAVFKDVLKQYERRGAMIQVTASMLL